MTWGVVALLVFVALAAFAAGLLVRSLSQRSRIERVADAAQELADGNLAHRVIMPGDDPAGRIATALNSLAEDVQAEREEAIMADASRKRFLAYVSHDLRTPITSIAGYVDALDRGLGDDPKRYLAVIGAKTEDLSRLTDDLFYAARLDADDLELAVAPLDLAEAVRRSILGFEPLLATRGVEARVELPDNPCIVDADASAVARILENLIANAIRHAPEMTTFGADLASDGDDFLVRRVCNDDARLPQDPETLFERGVAGPGGGAGIGLSIARELAARMGASLSVENLPEGRAEFVLAFPQRSAAEFRET